MSTAITQRSAATQVATLADKLGSAFDAADFEAELEGIAALTDPTDDDDDPTETPAEAPDEAPEEPDDEETETDDPEELELVEQAPQRGLRNRRPAKLPQRD